MLKEKAKELCKKSTCHHKCNDTKDCVVEDEAELLINEDKSNNFDVKSNEELFKQALVEGVNNRFNKILDEEEKTEEMATVIRQITTKCCNCEYYEEDGSCNKPAFMDCNENEDILIVCDALYEHNYRKQIEGKWIINRSPIEAEFKCSDCGYSYIEADPHTKTEYNYCPNCGAKMKGGE